MKKLILFISLALPILGTQTISSPSTNLPKTEALKTIQKDKVLPKKRKLSKNSKRGIEFTLSFLICFIATTAYGIFYKRDLLGVEHFAATLAVFGAYSLVFILSSIPRWFIWEAPQKKHSQQASN